MTATPPNSFISPQALKSNTCALTTANTTYTDTPSNAVLLITAGPNGSRVVKVAATPRETVTANQIQLYRDGNGSGTVKRLFNSVLMPATTVDATHAATPADFGYSDDFPLMLAPNENVYMAEGLTKSVAGSAEWGDY